MTSDVVWLIIYLVAMAFALTRRSETSHIPEHLDRKPDRSTVVKGTTISRKDT